MSIKPEQGQPDFRMCSTDLYREESFTDRRTGTIRRLSPVKPDGSADPGRRQLKHVEAVPTVPHQAMVLGDRAGRRLECRTI